MKNTPAKPSFLYEQIVADIAQRIDLGSLRPGDRLPSVRSFSQKHGVSISTVMQAYRNLEDRLLIEARPQSGFYVRPQIGERPGEPEISSPPKAAQDVSVTALIIEVCTTMLDPDVVPLGAAIPSPDLLPTRQLNRLLATVARNGGERTTQYLLPQGDLALRQEIARRSLDWGFNISADDIIITCGCMEALSLSLRAVASEGDAIAVESPTYFGVLQLIESLRMKAFEIPTHPRDGISLDALETAFQKQQVSACLFMPNFHNPLGCLMSDEKKQALAGLAAMYKIPIIEDDLYGDIFHEPPRPKALKAFDRDERVMYCSSFSKTLAPGFRVGWAVPGRHMRTVMQAKMASTIATAAPLQMAINEFLKKGGYDHHVRRLRRAYAQNLARMTEAVRTHFPDGTRATRPRGGFVLWIELPEGVDTLELYQLALKQKISVAPGPLFSSTHAYANCIRLNGGYPWSPRIESALKTLGELAGSLMP